MTAVPAPAPQGYRIASARVEDAEPILALWRKGLNQGGMPERKLDWFYRHNPGGAPELVFLHHESQSQPVGVGTIAPRQMRFDGAAVHGASLVDLAVDPSHRNFFGALFLLRELRRIASGRFDPLYAIPGNPRPLAVVPRSGYRLVGHKERWVRVLRSSEYLSRYLPSWSAAALGRCVDPLRAALSDSGHRAPAARETGWIEAPDERFDALWERAVLPGTLIGVRDRALLAWRFLDGPLYRCRFFVATAAGASRVVAYAACRSEGGVLEVMDFLADPAEPAVAWFWARLARAAYAEGHRSVMFHFMGGETVRGELARAGFTVRDKRAVFVAGEAREAFRHAAAWYLTAADEDG